MPYLLGTNTVSEPLRARPRTEIASQLREHHAEAAIPAPVWHELRFGCSRLPQSHRRRVIESYLDHAVLASFPVLPYNREAADWHALERARLGVLGRTPPLVDGQIASIAYINDLVLVTSNAGDFEHFGGLRVESWA